MIRLISYVVIALLVSTAMFGILIKRGAMDIHPVIHIPESVLQGNPMLLSVEHASSSRVSMTFNGKPVPTFTYGTGYGGLVAIDLNKKPGTYPVEVTVQGLKTSRDITVKARSKPQAPLGIPAQLGGNTPASQQTLVSTLAWENAMLTGLQTESQALWSRPFIYPLDNPVVTDTYGYTRLTGAYTIAHKGTDFRASEGTPVHAMNQGVVRLVQTFRNYGNTIVIDHGLGLMTLYMHLSEFKVSEGQTVSRGQEIALSGKTGYAEHPHLHISVRIGAISIDPMVFMELVGR